MQKVIRFFRSMKCGMILLGLIVLISIAGSLIPQKAEAMTYVRNYPDTYQILFMLQLDDVFNSWYFILTVVLLCINLTMCSIVRFGKISYTETPSAFGITDRLDRENIAKLKEYLSDHHFKRNQYGETEVYHKNAIGVYGTFLVHLGLLLTVISFALAMYLPVMIDETCMPGESIVLDDGTEIHVEHFSIEDEDGTLNYRSDIEITLRNGKSSGVRNVSVNHPVSLGNYKVYQQTYGTKGRLTVKDTEGHEDSFYLSSQDFLSADGLNGIYFDNLYPGFTEEDGKMTLITSTSGSYENPVYVFYTVVDGQQDEVMLAFPGDSIEAGEFTFTFEDPVEYPGLRIKRTPAFVNPALLISFLIMTLGLYMAFFMRPCAVTVSEEGYGIRGKDEGMELDLKRILKEEESV